MDLSLCEMFMFSVNGPGVGLCPSRHCWYIRSYAVLSSGLSGVCSQSIPGTKTQNLLPPLCASDQPFIFMKRKKKLQARCNWEIIWECSVATWQWVFCISGCVAATRSCRRGPSHTLVKSDLKQVGAEFLCLWPVKYSHPLRKFAMQECKSVCLHQQTFHFSVRRGDGDFVELQLSSLSYRLSPAADTNSLASFKASLINCYHQANILRGCWYVVHLSCLFVSPPVSL